MPPVSHGSPVPFNSQNEAQSSFLEPHGHGQPQAVASAEDGRLVEGTEATSKSKIVHIPTRRASDEVNVQPTKFLLSPHSTPLKIRPSRAIDSDSLVSCL